MVSPTGLMDDVESLKRRLKILKKDIEDVANACSEIDSIKQDQTLQLTSVASELQDARQVPFCIYFESPGSYFLFHNAGFR